MRALPFGLRSLILGSSLALAIASSAAAGDLAAVPRISAVPADHAAACTDGFDPNEVCGSGLLLGLGSSNFGPMVLSGYNDTGDQDLFRIDLLGSERLTATMTFTAPAGNAELKLLASCAGSVLSSDAGAGLVRTISYTNSGATTNYVLSIRHYDVGVCRQYMLTILIEPTCNLDATAVRSGWTGPIVPRNDAGGGCCSNAPTATLDGATNDTYLNYSFSQTGPVNTPSYAFSHMVDGVTVGSGRVAEPAAPNNYWIQNAGPYTVRGGRHTIGTFVDNLNEIHETNDGDNAFSAQFVWSPLDLTRGTPLVRAAPPDGGPHLPPLQNNDGFRFVRPNASYAWVISMAAQDVAVDDDLYAFDDYSGSTSGFSNLLKVSQWAPGYTDFIVGHYAATPTTVYPAAILFAAPGGGGAYDIDAMDAQGRNGILDTPASWTGQVMAANRLADVYEAYMSIGTTWYLQVHRRSGTSRMSCEVFPGIAGTINARGQGYYSFPAYGSSEWDVMGPYHSTETGWHPVVVYRDMVTGADQPVTYDLFWNTTGPLAVDGGPASPSTQFLGARPNPLTAGGRLDFTLSSPGRASLALFDPSGRRVRTLANGAFGAGRQSISWDGADDRGQRLAAGVYWARLETRGQTFDKKVVVPN